MAYPSYSFSRMPSAPYIVAHTEDRRRGYGWIRTSVGLCLEQALDLPEGFLVIAI
jgi:hypothetical protein